MTCHFAHRRGNILLLALLLLAGGMVGGLTVGTLVVADLRQARAIDNGLVAYVKAESGLEESLYDVRQADRCSPTGSCNDTDYLSCGLPVGTDTTADCQRKIRPANVVQLPYLEADQNFQLDFSAPLTVASTIGVNWNRLTPTGIDPALEVSYLESYLDLSTGQTKLRVFRPGSGIPYSCQPTGLACATITLPFPVIPAESGLTDLSLYQVRFRALRSPIVGLNLTPSASNTAGYLDVWSKGAQAGASQTLQTTVPRRAPAYGFSDYVIFSEQDIVK